MNTTNTKDIEIENAWGKNVINFCLKHEDAEICSAAFDGLYISLVSVSLLESDLKQYCTILDRGLKVHCYFELFSTRSLEVRHHVYTEQRGLVCGGSDGSIAITKFQDWEPQQSRTIGRMNGGEVSALTTRGDLIAAASTSGEVALWNYEGLKIATVEVKGSSIRDLSIRDTNLLVVSNGDAYEFNLPMPTNANTIPSVLKLKKGGHHNLGQATWAAYDPEGKNILLERKTDVGNHTLQRFRPVLPLSSKDYDIYILSYREKREGFGQQNIVIERFDSGKTSIVREFQVDYIPIKSLWCDRERLYWIYRFGSRIRMVNLTDGLNFETNSTVQLAECFSLTYPNNR